MLPFPLQITEEFFAGFLALVPYAIAIVLLIGLMMWFLAWMSRYFEYLKTLESRWLDQATLDFVHRVLEGVWIAFMAIVVLAIAQTQSVPLHDVFVAFVKRVPSLFFAIFVMFAAAIVVRMLHRFAAYLRGELKAKPKKIAPPRALGFTEIVLKYVIYIAALAIAILGGIQTLPPEDQTYFAVIAWPSADVTVPATMGVLVALLLVAIADRFVDSIFEDMKRRTRKFSSRIVDEFKTLARYSIWLIGAIILLFVLLDLILSQERLVIFAVGFVALLMFITIIAFDPARNALAGVTLLRADPFDVGDRVKIGEDLVADVIAMSLTLTQVRTLRGEIVSLPNSRLLLEPIVNFSRSKPYALSVEIEIGFEVDHARVHELLLQAATASSGIATEPAPRAFTKEVEGDTIRYQLLVYTNEPERMKEVKSQLIERVQDAFATAGIRPRSPGRGA